MKKSFSICLALMLLLGCFSLSGAAAEDATITNSVDIVVLVDMSKSMKTADAGSDPSVYRLDAAEMLVAMCDENSRVLYVPFGGEVLTGSRTDDRFGRMLRADTAFQELKSLTDRKTYMERIERDKTEIKSDPSYMLKSDTDYGEALRYAVEKINARADSEHNQPMIVLLSDGTNYIGTPDSERYTYLWDSGAKQWKRSASAGYNTAAADKLADDATQACVQLGIPVYTISLMDDKATGKSKLDQEEASRLLAQIATTTGGDSKVVPSSNADELPSFFGQIFATRIGGSMQRSLQLKTDGNDSYVNIPILNKSIREVNILLPMKSVDQNSIRLTDGKGNNVALEGRPDVSVLYGAKNSPFWLFKITNPDPDSLGVWNLRFRLASGVASGTKVSLGVVFNYNLTLQTRIGKTETELTAEDAMSLSKNADLYVECQFIDNSTEQPADDLALYQRIPNAEEDWWEIRATASLYREGETTPVSQRLTNFSIDPMEDRFFSLIPLRAGGAGLEAGSYVLRVKVEGAGLSREMEKHLTLTNSNPTTDAYSETHYVDYATTDHLPADANTSLAVKIKLNDLVHDEDGDALDLTLQEPAEGGDLLTNAHITRDGTVRYFEATIAGAPGHYASGVSRQVIHVTDNQSEGVDLELAIHIISGIELAKQSAFTSYLQTTGTATVKQALEGDAPQASVGKNVEVTQVVQFSPAAGDTTVKLSDFDIVLSRTNDQGGQVAEAQPLEKEESQQTVKYITAENEGVWNAQWTVSYLGQTVRTYNYAVTIENHKPALAEGVSAEEEMHVDFNELPSFLGFLNAIEGNTPEEELTFDLDRVFVDMDDELTYSIKYLDNLVPEEAAVRFNDPNQEDHLLKVTPQSEGTAGFVVTAMDNDGETVSRTYTFHTKDLTKMWLFRGLIALAALAALIILILIVHQARKPVFKQVKLGVREGLSLYDTTEYDLPPTKKPWPMSYVVDPGMAAKFSIPDVTLQNLIMEPARSVDGTVKVSNRKPVGSVQVTLEGNPVGKHAVRWSPGQAIELHATPNSNEFLRIVLSSGDSPADYAQPAGMDDAFGGTSEFSGNFGVPDGFDVNSASNFGAPSAGFGGGFSDPGSGGFGAPADGGFGSSSGQDFGSTGGPDTFDFGAPSNPPGGSDF